METYKQKANEARKKILTMIHKAGTSHIASNFSVIDIATVLYDNLGEKDEVVWSAGWKSATIYYFLAQQGKIPKEDLEKFGKEIDGKIEYLGLAETNINGVLCNGGSMGHGLPIACGIALAKKLKGEEGNVYCIMSDGEMNEGTTWESAMFASHNKLDNLVVIVDKNKWQAMGKTKDVLNVDPKIAFNGFAWQSGNFNGHNFNEIEKAIQLTDIISSPLALVFNTVKGKGVSFFEDHLLYHYKHVDKEEYEKAIKELNNG